MMLKFKVFFIALLGVLGLLAFAPQTTIAQSCANPTSAEEAIRCGSNEVGGGDAEPQDINVTIKSVLNIFSVIIGVLAVIMIMVGGFKFITGFGDPNNIKSARETILYALIGLVVVALAQVIVRFVLSNTTRAGG